MNKKIFGLVCGLMLVLLIVAGCKSEKAAGTTSETATGAVVSEVDEAQNGDFREIEVISKQYDFSPSVIKVKQGEKIRLRLKSVDVPHSLAIKAPFLNVNQYVEAGTDEVIEFTATDKGEFPFWCAIYCGNGHREMRGSLVVE
ncbi:cupredoxin domain-containing protein [Candidatus Woesearchaeota archaeon]|nr:cupredoxin domain-containing protein [Candidatus Woesearchaeota archaeon]